ncbi:hypothetical protein RJT34_32485 [Clitoria ternatea]|uniref:Uncharacterized protein n=1 Tax=Clitoria ternatea TaxID=43366 RepID=A0AAN9EW41_CLITE
MTKMPSIYFPSNSRLNFQAPKVNHGIFVFSTIVKCETGFASVYTLLISLLIILLFFFHSRLWCFSPFSS